ncbi:MAG: EI24 domain-containing protein [Lentisphaeria bacterium]|nr:EI24 domain-containing protein [Lentisphaeria bacterium]
MKDFFRGACCAIDGIKYFYNDRSLWKHTIGPWLTLLAAYTGITWVIFRLAGTLASCLTARMDNCPAFLKTLLEGSLTLVATLLAALIVLTTLSTLFEIFGGVFFDRLIEEFEKKYYNTTFPRVPFSNQLLFTLQAAWFGFKTALLFLILLLLSFFLPFAGQLLLVLFVGIRMAYSLLFAPGFLRGQGIEETKEILSRRKMELLGFGVAVYLLQLIPLMLPLTLPGMILGAVMLYNGPIPALPRQTEE